MHCIIHIYIYINLCLYKDKGFKRRLIHPLKMVIMVRYPFLDNWKYFGQQNSRHIFSLDKELIWFIDLINEYFLLYGKSTFETWNINWSRYFYWITLQQMISYNIYNFVNPMQWNYMILILVLIPYRIDLNSVREDVRPINI